jgi:hypothetical protein
MGPRTDFYLGRGTEAEKRKVRSLRRRTRQNSLFSAIFSE